jgi:DAK2 domain fusion protein YloV
VPDPSLVRFRRVVDAACAALEARRQEINDLNVFPVADGDTGDNMARTLRAVSDELERIAGDERSVDEIGRDDIVQAVARAALLGARGNSGVILSQIVRGLAEEFASRPGEPIDPVLVASALGRAADAAYASVREPAEGTMLTVIREVAHRVSHAVAHMDSERARIAPGSPDELQDRSLARLMADALEAGEQTVRRSPEQLAVLRESGVVDSGGYGLVVIIGGIVAALAHDQAVADGVEHHFAPRAAGRVHVMESSAFRYCTNFAVTGDALDVSRWSATLEQRGDSVLVVGDANTLRVHIHTDDPQDVIALLGEVGEVIDIEIEDMHEQTAARNERLGHHDAPGLIVANADGAACGVVAVASGEGIARLLAGLGATVVDGGPTLNPSTDELLAAIAATGEPEVLVLPNSPNVILAAEHAARLASKPTRVIPVASQQAALSILVSFDPSSGAEVNERQLSEALAVVRSGGVARAARADAQGRFAAGEAVGYVDDELVAWGEPEPTLRQVLESLGDGAELVTCLCGDGAPLPADRIRQLAPREAELELHDGGQPNWWWLISAE